MDFYCMLLGSCWCLENMALLNQHGFSWTSKGIFPSTFTSALHENFYEVHGGVI